LAKLTNNGGRKVENILNLKAAFGNPGAISKRLEANNNLLIFGYI
jgi:hypothetical protein